MGRKKEKGWLIKTPKRIKRPSTEVIILSGLSGSGKSSGLHILEDSGYFAIDNLPGPLLPQLLQLLTPPSHLSHLKKMALVMDAREMNFLKDFKKYLEILRSRGIQFKILFFDAQDEILVRRFSETRRRHPLSPLGRIPIGIQRERDLLNPLHEIATHIIDTSYLNIHELREKIKKILKTSDSRSQLSVSVISFGYRYGLPLEADIVMDLRFLPNPHFIERLRPLSGQDSRVSHFIFQKKESQRWLKLLKRMLTLLLRQYVTEGKSYVTIAFGCTGGRHRSVALSEKIANDLKHLGYPVKIYHRDLSRGK